MNHLLSALLLFSSLQFCSGELFAHGGTQVRDINLPNEWGSVADCPMRYYDLGYSYQVAPTAGVPAYEREFAHMAAIGWTADDGSIVWNCGGSLVTPNFVLTAAHCGFWKGKQPDVVRMGDLDLSRDDDNKYAQQIRISEVILHPEYKGRFRYHDVALLRLNQSVELHDTVCPACLWDNSTVPFRSLEACGYGQTGIFDEKTPRLLKVTLAPVNNSACSEYYPPDRKLTNGLTKDQICALDPSFKQDTCLGDSGGPLQIKVLGFARIHPFLIGVTSFGKSCGTETPGVYTRVSSYIDWIERVTNETFEPVACSHRYAQYREYEPDVITGTSKDGTLQYIDATRTHFDPSPRRFGHRATIEPGYCGGTFIHEQFVVTSASCVSRFKPEFVFGKGEGQFFEANQTFIHPKYRPGSSDSDIALVQLLKPITFIEDELVPGCLFADHDLPEIELEVTGWGPTGAQNLYIPSSPQAMDQLFNEEEYLAARSPQVPFSECNAFYEKQGQPLTRNSVCFGNFSFYLVPNTCHLDNGGPLGRKYFGGGARFHAFVMGINSHGNDCGFGFPVVATKVANYIDWIDSVVFGKVRPKDCDSRSGRGKCVLASECPEVVLAVKSGASLTDFVCDFDDPGNPMVCCPKKRTKLEECSSLYKKFRKPFPEMTWKHKEENKAHSVMIAGEFEPCPGVLVSRNLVLTSSHCVNSTTPLPLVAQVGSPDCDQLVMVVKEVKNLSQHISVVVLESDVELSQCVVPICLWTDREKTPFELSSSPSVAEVVAYRQEKCRTEVKDAIDAPQMGCGYAQYVKDCEPTVFEALQTFRNESNLVVPYLVGFGTSSFHCEDNALTFFYEKVSELADQLLSRHFEEK